MKLDERHSVSPQRQMGDHPWSRFGTLSSPYIAAAVAFIWYFRVVIQDGRLPGNNGDARWTIAVVEHWHAVFAGHEPIRDLSFFFPAQRTLGMSDAYFLPGVVHSALRATGLGVIRSWTIAMLGTYLLGAVGVAALSSVLFRRNVTRVTFVLTACLSYPLVMEEGHVQLFAMLWWSWIVLALIQIIRGDGGQISLWVLAVGVPMLALTAWYPLALGMLVLGVVGVTAFAMFGRLVGRFPRAAALHILALARRPAGLIAFVFSLSLWFFAAWVYLPARSLVGRRSWLDVVPQSPRWSDLFNGYGMGGGIWSPLYRRMYPDTSLFNAEQSLGVTPLLFGFFVLCLFIGLRQLLSRRDTSGPRSSWAAVLVIGIAIGLVWALFLVDERSFGLFRLAFEYVPAMDSVRAPFRVQILIYPLILFIVFTSAEQIFLSATKHTRALTNIMISLLGFVILLEMSRPADPGWTAELVTTQRWNQIPEIVANCDAFVFTPTEPAPYGDIDAVMLSMLSGVPTVNGYSGGSPVGHSSTISDGQTTDATRAWLQAGGFQGSLCLAAPTGVVRIAS